MKRQQKKKKSKVIAKKKMISSRAKKWIVALSITIGITLGFLLWYYVTRCPHHHCFFHRWPLKEVLFFGTLFTILQIVFLNEELYKKKYKR